MFKEWVSKLDPKEQYKLAAALRGPDNLAGGAADAKEVFTVPLRQIVLEWWPFLPHSPSTIVSAIQYVLTNPHYGGHLWLAWGVVALHAPDLYKELACAMEGAISSTSTVEESAARIHSALVEVVKGVEEREEPEDPSPDLVVVGLQSV